jgi:purine-nucleoside/S-methyl-5'-thioadenosine phosphorylase / adenosine deaminase
MTVALLRPQWPAPARVAAYVTTRVGGVSAAPFDSFNLAEHVGDEPAAVAANRRLLIEASPGLSAIAWLQQVHGTTVVAADAAQTLSADALYTRQAGLGCAVMTADCLPVLFCDAAATQVAAAHAGWRGLCAGVLEHTVASFADPRSVMAWLGPAIGSRHFEVGAEVRAQFLASAPPAQRSATELCFTPSSRPEHFYADIYQLARLRLSALGIYAIYGGGLCTFADSARWFSYRRDAITGRMASLIYLMPDRSDA